MTLDKVFLGIVDSFKTVLTPMVINYIVALSPIILAIILGRIFWDLWMRYVRAQFFVSQKYAVIEIRLPKDLYKSPLAMEMFLNSFHNTSDGNWYKQLWMGKTRPWFSLEMISVEGQVKFFIWMPESVKNNIQTALYATFPGIEVHEKDDYTRSAHFDKNDMKVWATEFVFTQPDSYPIKTYVDYGLDKDPKEEFKVDPLVPFLEFLGSIGPNQQVWAQIMIRAHKKEQPKPGHLFKKHDAWKESAKEEVHKILMRDAKTKVAGMKDEESGFTKMPSISKGEQAIVEALERSVSKQSFDAGIRVIYMAKKDFFNPSNIVGIIGNFKHFSSEHLNGFKPGGPWMGKIEYPWQDYKDIRQNRMSKQVIMAYKRRSYFYPPFAQKPLVLNVEELATLFHFPGAVASTPTLERVPSKKSEAPANLPI
ncbi:MAG: hypothetical protein WCO48_02095 [Candidatus Taylorbacteria bacterium]